MVQTGQRTSSRPYSEGIQSVPLGVLSMIIWIPAMISGSSNSEPVGCLPTFREKVAMLVPLTVESHAQYYGTDLRISCSHKGPDPSLKLLLNWIDQSDRRNPRKNIFYVPLLFFFVEESTALMQCAQQAQSSHPALHFELHLDPCPRHDQIGSCLFHVSATVSQSSQPSIRHLYQYQGCAVPEYHPYGLMCLFSLHLPQRIHQHACEVTIFFSNPLWHRFRPKFRLCQI
mmetsp:Transcript_50401/g.105208  ORF Transcript_50401/g.105208 Transcript_50401/m.105208 type:complete len:229 (-) Transcript_50401:249-935(-)